MTAPLYPVSDHCDGRRFFNPDRSAERTFGEVLRWNLNRVRVPWPSTYPTITTPDVHTPVGRGQVRVTWIGHATFLLQYPGLTLLTDPVFSQSCSPIPFLGKGFNRVQPPALGLTDLPRIDVVLLSHDHYDHCDLRSLRELVDLHQPSALTPLGNGDLLRRAGFSAAKITELDWWQSHPLAESGARLTVTPAQHWSKRLSSKRNQRLWGGFHIQGPNAGPAVYFVGDTGYRPNLFNAIPQRLGPPHLALIPIGAYEPRWFMREQHCDPAEAVAIHRECGARQSLAMHWATFRLADDGYTEPGTTLAAAVRAAGLPTDCFNASWPGSCTLISA